MLFRSLDRRRACRRNTDNPLQQQHVGSYRAGKRDCSGWSSFRSFQRSNAESKNQHYRNHIDFCWRRNKGERVDSETLSMFAIERRRRMSQTLLVCNGIALRRGCAAGYGPQSNHKSSGLVPLARRSAVPRAILSCCKAINAARLVTAEAAGSRPEA